MVDVVQSQTPEIHQKVEDGTAEDGWIRPVVVHICSQGAHILQLDLFNLEIITIFTCYKSLEYAIDFTFFVSMMVSLSLKTAIAVNKANSASSKLSFATFLQNAELKQLIIPEPNIVIGKVIKGVIVGVDNAPGGRVVPPDSPDHHGLNGGRLQHGQLVLLAQGLEAGQPLGELDDELDCGEDGLGHMDQGLVLDIRLVVDEAVDLVQQVHAGVLQLSLGLDQVVDQFSLIRGRRLHVQRRQIQPRLLGKVRLLFFLLHLPLLLQLLRHFLRRFNTLRLHSTTVTFLQPLHKVDISIKYISVNLLGQGITFTSFILTILTNISVLHLHDNNSNNETKSEFLRVKSV